MKKIIRIISKKFAFIFFKAFSKILNKFEYKIIPSLDESKNKNFRYSEITRRLIYKNPKNKFPKIIIDTSHSETELCKLGAMYGTNKSALNEQGHRSGYTPYYNILFRHLKDEAINFAEIGIEKNSSTQMWRKYFNQAKIYGFENDLKKIEYAKNQNLKKTYYHFIDITKPKIIHNVFKKINKKFDIIIDDSTHWFNDQIGIVKNVNMYLKNKGILIIEDLYKNRTEHDEKHYYSELVSLKKIFNEIYFVEFHNLNNYTASWKCEKILVLIKK